MEKDQKDSIITVTIHLAAGILLGVLSPMLGRALYAVSAALITMAVLRHVTYRVVGRKELSWWAGNGLFIYIFIWIDAWILAVNFF